MPQRFEGMSRGRKLSNDNLAWLQTLIRCEDGQEVSASHLSNKLKLGIF